VVPGVIVAAALVVNYYVLLPFTVIVPAVPAETYPALIVGVTDLLALVVAVISPVLLTLIDGFAVIVVAGVVALPFAILLLAALA
jgi:hypothetical protein